MSARKTGTTGGTARKRASGGAAKGSPARTTAPRRAASPSSSAQNVKKVNTPAMSTAQAKPAAKAAPAEAAETKTTETKTAETGTATAKAAPAKQADAKVETAAENLVEASKDAAEAAVVAGRKAAEAAVDTGTAISGGSFEQAATAAHQQFATVFRMSFDMFKTYEEAVSFNKDNVDAVVKSSTIVAKGLQDLGSFAFGMAQASFEESMNATKALMSVRNVQELADLQAGFAKSQYEKMVKEGSKLSEQSMKLAEQAYEPLQSRVTVAVERFGKPAV